jgi:hypothetical protein
MIRSIKYRKRASRYGASLTHTFGGIFSHQFEHQTWFRLTVAVGSGNRLNVIRMEGQNMKVEQYT